MRTFHFNPQYNMVGVAFLLASGLFILLISYRSEISGSINMTIPPMILCIFLLGYFTGRPCLIIHPDHFEYRAFPLKRNIIVYLDDIVRVDIQDKEIMVHCKGQASALKIKSRSFNKDQLPEVTEYFASLNETQPGLI